MWQGKTLEAKFSFGGAYSRPKCPCPAVGSHRLHSKTMSGSNLDISYGVRNKTCSAGSHLASLFVDCLDSHHWQNKTILFQKQFLRPKVIIRNLGNYVKIWNLYKSEIWLPKFFVFQGHSKGKAEAKFPWVNFISREFFRVICAVNSRLLAGQSFAKEITRI